MSTEQVNLFGDLGNDAPKKQVEAPAEKVVKTFLPGVLAQDAFPEINDFDELRHFSQNCQRCGLRATCKQVVFGDGFAQADLFLIGEGPGADEDEQGIPFVGRAGKLLDKIIVASELEREQVFISNVVKCRPPGNRLPAPNEVKICRNFLEAQIRLVQPKIIVCLGSAAIQAVIDPRAKISQIRGRWLQRNGIRQRLVAL
jgi:DNA polymerase